MASSSHPELRVTGPLGSRLDGYDRTQPPERQKNTADHDNDLQNFVDAMKVREEVFVHEQKVPLENEFDEDDPHCVHMVLYSKDGEPIGTIRIVPSSSTMHLHLDKHRTIDGATYDGAPTSSVHDGVEPFIKLGRLAVVSKERGYGYAADLVRGALCLALAHPERVSTPGVKDGLVSSITWRGLVLIHAQKQIQRFWARQGFELDNAMGIWDEEGIDHVAMWKRLAS